MDEKNLENKNDLFGFASFDKYESEHIAAPQYSYWKSVWRTFVKNKFTVAVAILMLVLVLFALIQPSISGYDPLIAPNVNNSEMRFIKPCAEHIFDYHVHRRCGRRDLGLLQEYGQVDA